MVTSTTTRLIDAARQALWPVFRAEWIVHEDNDLVVVNKPPGLATHPPEPDRTDDAHTRLLAFRRARGDVNPYLGIHQRLDRETSGVLLFTRRREANAGVAHELERRLAKKTYLAIVVGRLPERGELRHRLAPGDGGTMRVLPRDARGGQEAVTRYRVLERKGQKMLVELVPETGRTHQLRVQLSAAGAPIAGDPRYGGEPAPRLFLHAAELTLKHPGEGRPATFRAPVPPSFRAWLEGRTVRPFENVDAIEQRMRVAAFDRYAIAQSSDTNAFRIVNDSGDGLPGVTVDVYGDFLVVALLGDEALGARELVLDAAHRLGFRGVYVKVRPKHASRVVDTRREDVAPKDAIRGENAPDTLTILESGLSYEVKLGDGLSTGIFLDQRENRRRLRELSRDRKVLNLFAYTGAFSVAAAAGGAASTTTVDVSKSVLAWAERNLGTLGLDPKSHAVIEADVLGWLKHAHERYDLIVLDPPSFSTTKRSRWSAESDYASLAALCYARLAEGGRLLACTNHRGIPRIKLRRFLHEAARAAGRSVVQMKDLPDPTDFPPEPGRESHLKSILVTLA